MCFCDIVNCSVMFKISFCWKKGGALSFCDSLFFPFWCRGCPKVLSCSYRENLNKVTRKWLWLNVSGEKVGTSCIFFWVDMACGSMMDMDGICYMDLEESGLWIWVILESDSESLIFGKLFGRMSMNMTWRWCGYMEVSWNGGTSKSSILIGWSILNHPFYGDLWGSPHIWRSGGHILLAKVYWMRVLQLGNGKDASFSAVRPPRTSRENPRRKWRF